MHTKNKSNFSLLATSAYILIFKKANSAQSGIFSQEGAYVQYKGGINVIYILSSFYEL